MVIVVLYPLDSRWVVGLIGALCAIAWVQVFLQVNLSPGALTRGIAPLVDKARALSGPVHPVVDLPFNRLDLCHGSLEFRREHSPSRFYRSAISVPFVAGSLRC